MIVMLLIFIAAMVGFALIEAKRDADAIRAHRLIDHRDRLEDRAFFGTIAYAFSMLACVIVRWDALFDPWLAAPWAVAGWASFTIAFRWWLNRFRDLHWSYISRSNAYDRAWISALGIERAGAAAYTAESVLFLSGLAWCLLLLE